MLKRFPFLDSNHSAAKKNSTIKSRPTQPLHLFTGKLVLESSDSFGSGVRCQLWRVVYACQPHTFIRFFPLHNFFMLAEVTFQCLEWPGGVSGGDYCKRDVPIPEPKNRARWNIPLFILQPRFLNKTRLRRPLHK